MNRVYGVNGDVDGTEEEIAEFTRTRLSSQEKVKVVSDSDSDGLTGTIEAFEDYSGTEAGTILATCTDHGLATSDIIDIIGTKYAGRYTITRVDDNSFYFTATWDGDEDTASFARAARSGDVTMFQDYSDTEAGTVLATCTAHGLVTGDSITFTGSTSYNSTYTITKVDANRFYFTETYVPETGTWTCDGGTGEVTAFTDYSGTEAGTVLATSTAHGLHTGQNVTFTNSQNYNSTYEITVVDNNSFYFTETFANETGDWECDGGEAAISSFEDYSGTEAGTVKANATTHGFFTGQTVTISGSTNFNDAYEITVIDDNSFYFTETWAEETGDWAHTGATGTIVSASDAGGGEVSFVCQDDHGLHTGESVTISGTTDYNDTYTITVIDANEFKVTETFTSSQSGSFTAASPSGAFTKFEDYSGTVAGTVKATDTSHGLVTGQEITITNSVNYNDTYTVTVIDANSVYFTETYVPESGTGTGADPSGTFTQFEDYSGTVAGTVKATDTSHGLVTGQTVTITNSDNYNGNYVVTKIDANSVYFTETYVAENGTWTGEDLNGTFAGFYDYSGTQAGTVRATDTSHGLVTGQQVTISGSTNYNSSYTVTKIDANAVYFTETFATLETASWTCAAESGTITAFTDYSGSQAGTVAAYSEAHGLLTGQTVVITSSTNYAGSYTITKIDNDSFYFTATWAGDDDITATFTGAGAIEVTLTGTNDDGETVSEVITMNGENAVTATNYYRTVKGQVTKAGSSTTNVGNISIKNNAANATVDYIAAGKSVSRSCFFPVPADTTCIIHSWWGGTSTAAATHLSFYQANVGGETVYTERDAMDLYANSDVHNSQFAIVGPAEIIIKGTGNNSVVNAGFEYTLE